MFDRKFLESYGLYRKCWLKLEQPIHFGSDPPKFQHYCHHCDGMRTYHLLNKKIIGESPIANSRDLRGAETAYPAPGITAGYEYSCGTCGSPDRIQFMIRYGIEGLSFEDYSLYTDRQISEQSMSGKVWAMKVGQFPAWSIDPPPELRRALQTHEDTYKRGSICESQGYGIGAFAYYRRIVENIIDELLADIGSLLTGAEQITYSAALADLNSTIVAKDKIAVVKEILPSFLRPRGINPLGTLHEALSVGIHELSEEDCLTLAEGIRTSLAMLAKHIALAKHDKDEYAKSMSSVRETLDKIRKKFEPAQAQGTR